MGRMRVNPVGSMPIVTNEMASNAWRAAVRFVTQTTIKGAVVRNRFVVMQMENSRVLGVEWPLIAVKTRPSVSMPSVRSAPLVRTRGVTEIRLSV